MSAVNDAIVTLLPRSRHPTRFSAAIWLCWLDLIIGSSSIVPGKAIAQDQERDANARPHLINYDRSSLPYSLTILPQLPPQLLPQAQRQLAVNRLRFDLGGKLNSELVIELQADNETAFAGNPFGGNPFGINLFSSNHYPLQLSAQSDVLPAQNWRLDSNYAQSPDILGRRRFYYADDRALLRWHGNRDALEFSVVAGKFAGDRVLAADIATQIGNAGIRGELSYTRPRIDSGSAYRSAEINHYQRALIGADYVFSSNFTVSAELCFNGAGAADVRDYDFAALTNGRLQNVGRRYVGLFAGYNITPWLKTTYYFATNLVDGSRYFSPGLTYSVRKNVDWTIGVQSFSGGAGSEYGRFNNIYYTQVQKFF